VQKEIFHQYSTVILIKHHTFPTFIILKQQTMNNVTD